MMLFEYTLPLRDWMKNYNFVLVQSIEQLSEIVDKAIASGLCAWDIETTGLDSRVFNGKCNTSIVGYSLAYNNVIGEDGKARCDTGYYIPIRHGAETDKGFNLPVKETNALIDKLLNSDCVCTGHNSFKFDAEMLLQSEGINLPRIATKDHDTLILAKLAGKQPAGLKYLSKTLLKKEMFEIDEILSGSKEINFADVTPYQAVVYAASDAICSLELFFHPDIQKPLIEQKQIYGIERKIMTVVRQMERNRVKLDLEHTNNIDKELRERILETEKSLYAMVEAHTNGAIKEFKLDSPEDVSHIMFDESVFNMEPKPEKGKKGTYKTDADVLEKLAPKYPFAKKMSEYRTLTKFHRTYIVNLIENVDQEGYIKLNFDSLGTDTGRFSSKGKGEGTKKDPAGYAGINVQSTPARYDESSPNVRKCFSCEQDEVIAALDYSGVEIRVGANLSKEPIWEDRFLKGDGDVHTSTAAICYQIDESEVTKLQRSVAKTINFQTMYGGSPQSMAPMIGVTVEVAKQMVSRFFGALKTINRWIGEQKKLAAQVGYCKTQFGRIRYLPNIKSDEFFLKSADERKAVNTAIQGSAADLMKLAMIEIDKYIKNNYLENDVQLLMTIHDELVFRIKKNKVDVIKDLVEVMKLDRFVKGVGWKIPLAIDAEVGSSWDVEYEYQKIAKFLKEVKNIDKVAYLYSPECNYEETLKECEEYFDKKKKEKAEKRIASSETKLVNPLRDYGKKIEEDFDAIEEDVVKTLQEITPPQITETDKIVTEAEPIVSMSALVGLSVSDTEHSANPVEEIIIPKEPVKLSDLSEEDYNRLKKSFFEKEFDRIISERVTEEDIGIEKYVVVHKPITKDKMASIGHLVDSCKDLGRGKILFVNQNKEIITQVENVDILKASVLCKMFNL